MASDKLLPVFILKDQTVDGAPNILSVGFLGAGTTSNPRGRDPRAALSRRQPKRRRVGLFPRIGLVLMAVALVSTVLVLLDQHRHAEAAIARRQGFVNTAQQTVLNMFNYNQETIDESVDRFVDGTSGPLRDMLHQGNNADNLKAMFPDTEANSVAVVNSATLEKIDEVQHNAAVLVAAQITVTSLNGVNRVSQTGRIRVIVHEDDKGRMTGYDLEYPDGNRWRGAG